MLLQQLLSASLFVVAGASVLSIAMPYTLSIDLARAKFPSSSTCIATNLPVTLASCLVGLTLARALAAGQLPFVNSSSGM